MSVIKIPPVLRASVGGAKEVEASGSDVGEVLRALADQHPATRSQVFSEDGALNRYVNVYVNDEDVRVLDGLETAVAEGDTIVILPAMAGGAHSPPTTKESTVTTISKLDYVAVPTQDTERSRGFYGETLGLRSDEHVGTEFWVGETCLSIWEPAKFGIPFAPQKNAHLALHVEDVAAARRELEAKGVEFSGDVLDSGVCHMAFFTDPDGNDLMLHSRYAPAG